MLEFFISFSLKARSLLLHLVFVVLFLTFAIVLLVLFLLHEILLLARFLEVLHTILLFRLLWYISTLFFTFLHSSIRLLNLILLRIINLLALGGLLFLLLLLNSFFYLVWVPRLMLLLRLLDFVL